MRLKTQKRMSIQEDTHMHGFMTDSQLLVSIPGTGCLDNTQHTTRLLGHNPV